MGLLTLIRFQSWGSNKTRGARQSPASTFFSSHTASIGPMFAFCFHMRFIYPFQTVFLSELLPKFKDAIY